MQLLKTLQRFFTALVVIAALCGVYAYVVAPQFEPPPLVRQEVDVPEIPEIHQSTAIRDSELAKLFEPGSWELNKPKVIETEQCTLLIQDYKTLSDGRMELKPCTLVFRSTSTAADASGKTAPPRRLILRVPEGAVLQFDRPLDLAAARFGKLLGGKLSGDVTVYSPPTSPTADDAIRIRTSNLQIDYERAFTPHDVEFQYGKSFGSGRDLTIRLIPATSGGGSEKAAFAGVKSLELARVDRLHLEAASGGLFPGDAAAKAPSAGSNAKKQQPEPPLEVRCQGPLRFDFADRRIELSDRVEVIRVRTGEPEDRLTCELLLLDFAEMTPKASQLSAQQNGAPPTMERQPPGAAIAAATHLATAPATPSTASPAAERPQLERFFASGRPVILESPVTGTVVTAAELEYLPAQRRVAVRPDRDTPSVTLRHMGNQLDAVQVEYELSETRQIGKLWAKGPGRVKRELAAEVPGAPPRVVTAHWQQELRLRPQAEQHVLSLLGGARLEDVTMGRFESDELHLWMLEVPPPAQATADKSSPQLALLPDRILASGKVSLVSPQLDANTTRLECWFAHDVPLPDGAVGTAAGPAAPLGDGRLPPIGPAPLGPSTTTVDTQPLQKFRVRGNLVQAQVRLAGETPLLEDLALQGAVELDEVQTASPDDKPMQLRGDAVQLRGGLTQAKVEIVGRPASISARGISLAGGVIHFDRGAGRVWIDGPGRATMPMPKSRLGAPMDPMSEPDAPAEPVDVTWKERMTFDGMRVTMSGQVEARTAVVLATGMQLTADLTEPIDFQQLAKKKFAGDLKQLAIEGNAYVEHHGFDEYGQRTSLERLVSRKVTADMTGGTFLAEGPGWVSSTRPQSSITIDKAAGAPAPAGPLPAAAANQLAFVKIDYEGEIAGQFARRQVVFRRKVRAIYGPVAGWDQRFEATSLEELGERGVLLTGDELTATEMIARGPTGDPISWMELLASGNVVVEGRQFTARAGRISYTSEKELLIVEGSGRSDAEWWWREQTGARTAYNVARKFVYSRKTDYLDVEGGKVLDVQQLQGAGKDAPSILRR